MSALLEQAGAVAEWVRIERGNQPVFAGEVLGCRLVCTATADRVYAEIPPGRDGSAVLAEGVRAGILKRGYVFISPTGKRGDIGKARTKATYCAADGGES